MEQMTAVTTLTVSVSLFLILGISASPGDGLKRYNSTDNVANISSFDGSFIRELPARNNELDYSSSVNQSYNHIRDQDDKIAHLYPDTLPEGNLTEEVPDAGRNESEGERDWSRGRILVSPPDCRLVPLDPYIHTKIREKIDGEKVGVVIQEWILVSCFLPKIIGTC